jgi:hypothetical protein
MLIHTDVDGETWRFYCSPLSIQILESGRYYFCRLWINHHNGTIDWEANDSADAKKQYPQVGFQLAPILAVYPQLMDQLFAYFGKKLN